jgi:tRNA (adenine57-N1/adenine58-N1)-methyltransferase
MGYGNRFEPGEKALLVDERGRRYLITLQKSVSFHFHRGSVSHDAVIGESEGCIVRSSAGEEFLVLRPTLADFVLKMPRKAQVIYPKDIGMVLILGDIYPGATVVEAGIGSGALTIALLRAVGSQGRVISYEVREEFASTALENIEAFLGKAENLEVRIANFFDGIEETGVDRVILDLPEPWRAVEAVAPALRPGGIFVSYLPTVLQVRELTDALREDGRWAGVSTSETLHRGWHVEGQSIRPEHHMIGHTGFITIARRMTPY